jgi:uncharacterized membrane protein
MRTKRRPIVLRWTVLALIFTVAAFSATAKHSQFLPKSNPAHFISNMSKMNVSHSPDLAVPLSASGIPKIIPAHPVFRVLATVRPEDLDSSQLGLTLSLQQRSPPLSLA